MCFARLDRQSDGGGDALLEWSYERLGCLLGFWDFGEGARLCEWGGGGMCEWSFGVAVGSRAFGVFV